MFVDHGDNIMNEFKKGFYPDFKSDEIGYSVRPINDNKILIMIELYKKDKREESLNKMRAVKDLIKNEFHRQTGEDIEVNIIDALEVLEQVDKNDNIEKSGCVEVIDLLTEEFIQVELNIRR